MPAEKNTQFQAQQALRPFSLTVTIFAVGFAVFSVLYILLYFYLSFGISDEIVVTAGVEEPSIFTAEVVAGLFAAVSILLALLCAGICWLFSLLWIHRAHSNIEAAGTQMDYSANWAVGSYFIPFVNLVTPSRAMRELYNRSMGEIPEHAHSAVDDVSAWWTPWVIGIVLTTLYTLKITAEFLTPFVFLTPEWMKFVIEAFLLSLIALSAIMLAKLCRNITDAQASGAHMDHAFE